MTESDGAGRYPASVQGCSARGASGRLAGLAYHEGVWDGVSAQIDLKPLHQDRDAAQMLYLARGQLNTAFRSKGLFPPDPLPLLGTGALDLNEMDDPAGVGLARVGAAHPDALAQWTGAMPEELAVPVLRILHQARASVLAGAANPPAMGAIDRACLFLLDRLEAAGDDSP